MSRDSLGQKITFATVLDPDEQYKKFIFVRVTRAHRTVYSLAAERGQPGMAQEIAKLNHVRHIYQKLKIGRLIRIPGTLEKKLEFDCHFQDEKRAVVKDGYAIFQVTARYGEKGITHFMGYNPLAIDVPILFEGWGKDGAGAVIEDKIQVLERMAGRGHGFAGAAAGPPAVIQVTCLDNHNRVVPLIPANFIWTPQNKTAPMWRVEGIDWDDGAISDDHGRRVRTTATVHLWEYTPVSLAPILTQRAKKKGN